MSQFLDYQQKPPRKSKRTLAWLVAGAILLLLIVGSVLGATRNSSKPLLFDGVAPMKDNFR